MKSLTRSRGARAVLAGLAAATATAAILGHPATALATGYSEDQMASFLDGPVDPPTLSGRTREDWLTVHALVLANPTKFADVYYDSNTDHLTVGVVDQSVAEGRALVEAVGVTDVTVKTAKYSEADLASVISGYTTTAGLGTVNSAYHDRKHDRVIVTATEVTPELRHTLHTLYGNMVVIDPDTATFQAEDSNRMYEDGPFYAGYAYAILDNDSGYISTNPSTGSHDNECTMGFSWVDGVGNPRMLTAGHCFPKDRISNFTFDPAGESSGVRTDYGSGDFSYEGGTAINSTYKDHLSGGTSNGGTFGNNGDFALINTAKATNSTITNRQGAPHLWVTNDNSVWVETVRQWQADGDLVCSSGMRSGEQCGSNDDNGGDGLGAFNITDPIMTWTDGETGSVFTDATKATKGWGQCIIPGDSGAPVYKDTHPGYVSAYGILSGGNKTGGSDYKIGKNEFWQHDCVLYYTAIGQAYEYWPNGHIEIGG